MQTLEAEYSYNYDWFSENIPVWERMFAPIKARPNLKFLEIGSFEGMSACWLLKNVLTDPTSSLTCVDLFLETLGGSGLVPLKTTPNATFDRNITATGAAHKVTKLRGASEDLLRELPALAYDFIYVDGWHHAAYVLNDAVLSWHCLKVGGLMCFDDYLWLPNFPPDNRPQKGVDTFLGVYHGTCEVLHKDYQVFVRKTRTLQSWTGLEDGHISVMKEE